MIYTYVIKSKKSGKLYRGYTNDLRKRFKEHNDNKSTYTKGRGLFELIYYEACKEQKDATSREIYLKSGKGKRYLKYRLKRFLFCTGLVSGVKVESLKVIMNKDYKNWHIKKSDLNDIEKRPFFHEREIWFCYLGVNVGFEQDGINDDFLRPVVIIRKFNNEIFWGIPLTKSKRRHKNKSDVYYYDFSFIPEITSVAILSQIRLIDAKRLSRHIGFIIDKDFENLMKKLKDLLP